MAMKTASTRRAVLTIVLSAAATALPRVRLAPAPSAVAHAA